MGKFALNSQNEGLRPDLSDLYYNFPPRQGVNFSAVSIKDILSGFDLLSRSVNNLDEVVFVHEATGNEPRVSLKVRTVSEGMDTGTVFDYNISIDTCDNKLPGFSVSWSAYGFSKISSALGSVSLDDKVYMSGLADFYERKLIAFDFNHIASELLDIGGLHEDEREAAFSVFNNYVAPIITGSLYAQNCLNRGNILLAGLESSKAEKYTEKDIKKGYSCVKYLANEALVVYEKTYKTDLDNREIAGNLAFAHYLLACAEFGMNGNEDHKFINWHLYKAVKLDSTLRERAGSVRSALKESEKVVDITKALSKPA